MINILPTRVVNFNELCSKELITDIKDAAICEVRTVCSLACCRCPHVVEYIDFDKVNLEGLSLYSIQLEKIGSEKLLVAITAPDIDHWLKVYHLSFVVKEIDRSLGKVNDIIDYSI